MEGYFYCTLNSQYHCWVNVSQPVITLTWYMRDIRTLQEQEHSFTLPWSWVVKIKKWNYNSQTVLIKCDATHHDTLLTNSVSFLDNIIQLQLRSHTRKQFLRYLRNKGYVEKLRYKFRFWRKHKHYYRPIGDCLLEASPSPPPPVTPQQSVTISAVEVEEDVSVTAPTTPNSATVEVDQQTTPITPISSTSSTPSEEKVVVEIDETSCYTNIIEEILQILEQQEQNQ